MGVRNPGRDELLRLEEKTLDAQFLTTIQQGLNCSPFESRSVLEVVKEVYFPFLAQAQTSALLPGKITLVGVCADEPAGKPIAKCAKRTVCLLLHRGAEDDRLLHQEGPDRFRRLILGKDDLHLRFRRTCGITGRATISPAIRFFLRKSVNSCSTTPP